MEAVSSSLAEIYRRRWLAVYFARREFSRDYRNSYLGFLWAFLSPLLMVALLTLIFSELIGLRFRLVGGDSSLNFGLFLYCGLLPFMAFSDALNKSSNSIRSNSALVQKVVFPVEILPLTRVITIQADKLFGLAALLLVVVVLEQRLEWTILWMPVIIAIQLVFVMGLSYLFAVLGTYLPDIRETLRAFVRVMFFATPIIWTPDMLPENLRFIAVYNPLAVLVNAYRNLILEARLPDTSSLLWFSLFSVVLLVVGFFIFVRTKQNFADLI